MSVKDDIEKYLSEELPRVRDGKHVKAALDSVRNAKPGDPGTENFFATMTAARREDLEDFLRSAGLKYEIRSDGHGEFVLIRWGSNSYAIIKAGGTSEGEWLDMKLWSKGNNTLLDLVKYINDQRGTLKIY